MLQTTRTTARGPDYRDVEVGRRIRAQRLSKGLSQTDLGRGLGVSFQQVQKYEKGFNRVGAGRLQAIAEILEVPITFFYAEDSAEPVSAARKDAESAFGCLSTAGAIPTASRIRAGRPGSRTFAPDLVPEWRGSWRVARTALQTRAGGSARRTGTNVRGPISPASKWPTKMSSVSP
jgi:transcriptional regulator with XRE-family HTH domain